MSTRSNTDRGELALLLHAHMPYVEGFGTWPFGEEWLLEAIATVYLPLIDLCERWLEQGEANVLTLNVSPVLADQLLVPAVGERFLDFVRDVRSETHRLDIEGLERAGDQAAADALRRSAHEYERAAERFEELGRDVVSAWRRLGGAGVIELWTSAATHAVLPLLASEAGVRLQVRTGIDSHRERFGNWGGGFWLPECAFRPGIEEPLAEAGVRAFCVYRHDADPLGALAPVATASGPVALPIDWDTISLVWDEAGYPADPVYRDYHAPTLNGMRPYANGGGGYVAEAACARAREHADHFVAQVGERLDAYRAARGRPGLLVCTLDAELLGHWWYEGPVWLEAVVARAREAGIALATLPEAIDRHEPVRAALAKSSWGEGKDLSTWDSSGVAELLWQARKLELALVARAVGRLETASLARAARELLALQSSDWAFMETKQLAADYPRQRVSGHRAEMERALAGGDSVDPNLRGLAPGLRTSILLEPPPGWGRTPLLPV
jgi:1,4-alpha-glucan branching enzyme